jgi:hypothetical protein
MELAPKDEDAEKTPRERVLRLERALESAPQVDCPVRHYFVPGMYAREMTIPAGVVLTGAVHKTEHLSTISAGRIIVQTDDGVIEIAAPYTFVSKPGAKRAGYALETTVWTTYHATETTDLDALVEELTESKACDLLGGAQNRQLQIAGKHKEQPCLLPS